MAIAPFQGPTFERGESKTAVDYILVDRQDYKDITSTDLWDRLWVRSDHNILEMQKEMPGLDPQPTRM